MARLGKRRRRLISIGRIGGQAPKVLRSMPADDSLELEASEYQVFSNSECENVPNSQERMAAEDNISPSEPREEACLYESEEDTDEEWELADEGSQELISLSYSYS